LSAFFNTMAALAVGDATWREAARRKT